MAKSIKDILDENGDLWLREKDIPKDAALDNLVIRDGFVTIPEYDEVESQVAFLLIKKAYGHKSSFLDSPEESIREAESILHISLSEGQRDAVKAAIENNVCVITGGPGTGKTTCLQVLDYCLSKSLVVKYVSPTGKAACRITESTGNAAHTCQHEFNNLDKQSAFFDADVLIVDEGSMLDIFVLSQILKCLKASKRLVIVGDPNQLLSVGNGQVLTDLIESGCIPCRKLTETFRQSKASVLLENIKRIERGNASLASADDFNLIKLKNSVSSGDIKMLNTIAVNLAGIYQDERKTFGCTAKEVSLLLPYKKSGFCTNVLSDFLQKKINPQKQVYRFTDEDHHTVSYGIGDMVINLKNRGEIVNGLNGSVSSISAKGVEVMFDLPSGQRTELYDKSNLNELALSYSMTIHKSQGSEYQSVIVVLLDCHKQLLNRNLLYTAVTRAKKKCTLICTDTALKEALGTVIRRNTMLKDKLIEEKKRFSILRACA